MSGEWSTHQCPMCGATVRTTAKGGIVFDRPPALYCETDHDKVRMEADG